jgi:hypothetical protein
MKKLFLFAFAFLFTMATMAQNRTVFLNETFDGTSFPDGWSVMGLGSTNWHISTTSNAGGSPNELLLYYGPQFNGISRFVSPAIDLTGVDKVVFSFKHALDNYSGSHQIGIATSSDDGTNWNVGWSQNYNNDGVWSVAQEIITPDMGHNNVRFCLFYQGYSYNIDNWYFDDFEIFTMTNLDLSLTSVVVPSFFASTDPNTLDVDVNIGFKVFNYGSTPVTSIKATCAIDGMDPIVETFNGNVTSLTTGTFQFNHTFTLNPGTYNVVVTLDEVNGVNDDNPANNEASSSFSVAMATTDRVPMIEHFSSSTCGPCVSVNNTMNTFCNNNQGRFTYTKYQMNWPGSGDPYYTEEGGVRRAYYGIGAVPNICFDGSNIGAAAVSQASFNQHAAEKAFFDIRGSFTVDGNNIHVLADIMPLISVNATVFVSVNEKLTTGNVGSNGETSFHHVFMKMLPDAYGSSIDFEAGQLQTLEFTQNMSSTHVEEMSDLEVAIWVQDYASAYMFNSHFAYEYTDAHPYAVQNLALVDNGDGAFRAFWDAPANATPVGYDVYMNGAKVMEGITDTQCLFNLDPDQFNVVGVVALYANEVTSVMSIAATGGAMQDMGLISETPTSVVMNVENPVGTVAVKNANYQSQEAIQVLSVSEAENAAGVQYLTLTPQSDLPATLEVGESFVVSLETNYQVDAKSVANTTVTVVSDAGSVEFFVEIDGELLNVTELSAETKLYPNPTSGNFIVEGVNVAGVEVYNLVGQKVYEQHDQKLVNINTANWNKGMYLVSVTNLDGKVETMKLMVK